MDKKLLAAQLYTLRDYTKTPDDIERTLKRIKDIGYDAVQVSAIGPIEPERLKEFTDRLEMSICATHISSARLENDIDSVISQHKLWDCRYVGLGSMPEKYRGSKDGYIEFAGKYSQIAKKLYDSGLKLIYHNHNFEFEKFAGRTGMDILFEESDAETFGFEIDTYWVQAGGADPVDWIEKVEGRMDVVHLKDMGVKEGKQMFSEIGEGNLDWNRIIKACMKTGIKWYAIEQDECLRDPFESLEISYNYLTNKEIDMEG